MLILGTPLTSAVAAVDATATATAAAAAAAVGRAGAHHDNSIMCS